MTKYLLFARHAKHESIGRDSPRRKLSTEGKEETTEVANKLRSVVQELKDPSGPLIRIGALWQASTDEALGTAKVFQKALGDMVPRTPLSIEELSPRSFDAYRNTKTHVELCKRLRETLSSQTAGNAVLVVGHQPLLGWMARRLTGKSIPIERSEVICIAFNGRRLKKRSEGNLLWVLSLSDESATMELKEKIKSKMESAKFLGGFITGMLAFLLASLVDQNKMAYLGNKKWSFYLSSGLFLAAVGMYLSAMYAYDRLLMPRRFWGEAQPQDLGKRPKWLVWRPPSSGAWVLYQNMMRIWYCLFTPATHAVVLGLLFLAYGVFRPVGAFIGLFWGVAAAAAVCFWLYYRRFGPKIGSQD